MTGQKKTKKQAAKAIYAGTFDPFTNGHLDILTRAIPLFSEIVILIANSPIKNPLFSVTKREKMICEVVKDYKNIHVDSWSGLTVDYAKKNNCQAIIRGLRPTGDFEFEFQMATMNKKLLPSIETVFLMTGEAHYFISSSMVKEVFQYGGVVENLVPKQIFSYLKKIKS